jgi:nucleotide-binding universal stress UspA family protein
MTAAIPDWKDAIESTSNRRDEPIQSIVLPLDDTDQSETALPVASKLRELYQAVLHVAYVGESTVNRPQKSGSFNLTEENMRGVVWEQSSGDPAEFVLRLTRELRKPLLVLCTALGTPKEKNRFGSIAESIFALKPLTAVESPGTCGGFFWRMMALRSHTQRLDPRPTWRNTPARR